MTVGVLLIILLVAEVAHIGYQVTQEWGNQLYPQKTITVTGDAVQKVFPHSAYLNFTLSTASSTVSRARDALHKKEGAVITSLNTLGIDTKDVSVNQFSIAQSVSESGASSKTRYEASENMVVKVTDKKDISDKVNKVMDIASAQNTSSNTNNTISSQAPTLCLVVEKTDPAYDTVRSAAMADAQKKALELAQLSSLTLGSLVGISDGTLTNSYDPNAPYPGDCVSSFSTAGVSPQQITGSVSLTFEVK